MQKHLHNTSWLEPFHRCNLTKSFAGAQLILLIDDWKYHLAGLVARRMWALLPGRLHGHPSPNITKAFLGGFHQFHYGQLHKALNERRLSPRAKSNLPELQDATPNNIIRSQATIKFESRLHHRKQGGSDKTPAKCFKGGTGWCLEWKRQHVRSKVPHSIGVRPFEFKLSCIQIIFHNSHLLTRLEATLSLLWLWRIDFDNDLLVQSNATSHNAPAPKCDFHLYVHNVVNVYFFNVNVYLEKLNSGNTKSARIITLKLRGLLQCNEAVLASLAVYNIHLSETLNFTSHSRHQWASNSNEPPGSSLCSAAWDFQEFWISGSRNWVRLHSERRSCVRTTRPCCHCHFFSCSVRPTRSWHEARSMLSDWWTLGVSTGGSNLWWEFLTVLGPPS